MSIITVSVPNDPVQVIEVQVPGMPGPAGPQGLTGPPPVIAGTSATSFLIGTGSKTFVTQAGMALSVGHWVRINNGANASNYMAGLVTAYSGTSLTVNVTETGGAGTFADWNIGLSGVKGNTGNTGAVPAIAGTSVTSFTPGAGSKVFVTQAGIQGFTIGQYVRIASASNPLDYMGGAITAYSSTSLTVNVVEWSGSTARTDWNISIGGRQGNTGAASTVPGPAPTISGTSATSATPSLGSKVFTTQAGMALVVGQYVRIASAAVPADYMAGAITAYSSTSLTVNVDAFSGVTARTDWNIGITGTTGAQGPTGSGASDATTTAKGSIMLAGHLGGTADAPTVTSGAGHTHTSAQVSDATDAATSNMVIKRDASGRAQVADGSAVGDIATRGQQLAGDRWLPVARTANYTFALTDEAKHVYSDITTAITFTIPTNATVAFPLGTKIQITRWGIGALTLAPAAGVTINASTTIRTFDQYGSCMIVKVGTDTWLLTDLVVIASESLVGMVELATAAETTTGTDTTRAVHPAGLKVELDKKAPTSHTHTASQISDSTAVGRSVVTAVDAAAARTAIGAGTSNLALGTTNTTAKAGDYQPTAANISDATATGRSVLMAADAAAARTAIGAGTSSLAIGTTSTTAKAGDYVPADATTGVKGIVQLTNHLGGTATAPTVRSATDTLTGIVELATTAEATTGTDTTRAVTPAGVKAVVDAIPLPVGTTLTVHKSEGVWPARPTARADVTVQWKGPDPSPTVVASGTGGMLDNVDLRFVTP